MGEQCMEFTKLSSKEESREVAKLARKVFGPGSGIIVPNKPKWAIYASDEKGCIKGGVILKRIGRKAGMIDFIFVDSSARGKGLGPALLKRGITELEKAGCSNQLAFIRDDNTPSWGMFARKGFFKPNWFRAVYPYSFTGFLYIMFMVFANTGYSFWLRSKKTPPEGTDQASQKGVALNIIVALIASLGIGNFGQSGMVWLLSIVAMIGGTTLLRILISYPLARAYGPVGYNNSHSGGLWSIILGLLGAWWPYFGMWVPKEPLWHYSKFKPYEGRAAIASWLATLLVYGSIRVLAPAGIANGLENVFTTMIIYEALPFIPFEGLDGYKVFRWNKGWYAIGVLASLALVISV